MKLPYSSVFLHSPGLEEVVQQPTLTPFSETVVNFVGTFSKHLLASSSVRRYPELATLAFWMRYSNIERLRNHTMLINRIYVARGVAFHLAPANVDTIFVYSWFLSLLCGNSNIVRVSSKASPQTILIFELMQDLFTLSEFAPIRDRSLVVHYGHITHINDLFSSYCDIRIIWGGDQSIQEIRKSPLPARACEMTFANKYSLAIIDVNSILNAEEDQVKAWVDGLYNDSYWFAQMACSSPRLVLWLGGSKADNFKARKRLWELFENRLASAGTSFDQIDYVNKRVAIDSLALNSKILVEKSSSNNIVRVWLDIPALHAELHCGAGLFFESAISGLDDILPLLSRQIQTVTYIGITTEQWQDFLKTRPVAGIDRIIPIGKALDFNYIWDGYDMPKLLLREITLS